MMDKVNKELQAFLVYLDQCSFDRRCEIKEALRDEAAEENNGFYYNAMANVIELSGDGPIVMHFTIFFKKRGLSG